MSINMKNKNEFINQEWFDFAKGSQGVSMDDFFEFKKGRLMMLIGCLYDIADRSKEIVIKKQLLDISKKLEINLELP